MDFDNEIVVDGDHLRLEAPNGKCIDPGLCEICGRPEDESDHEDCEI